MSIVAPKARPATLDTLIGQIRDAFDAMGDATPIRVGKQFLAFGPGSSPSVVFVPDHKPGKISPPYEMGHAVMVTDTCAVHVRGKESGDDLARYVAARALADRVISCIATGGTGRIDWGTIEDDSPTDVDAGYGAGLKITFSFRRDVLNDATRWGLPSADADTDDDIPVPPPGTPGTVTSITPTVVVSPAP